ncbi:MAG: hypothetical protein Q4G50_12710 [Corynebacterium sp.]|uniref:hypothetical protein n=1 Tax=Corynebacterium sp. TaxID=1720 RepID=UPI0026E0E991|nr:hypothetical protein [Corynebacterium sp.]MDO5670846.1 hypothetical protein [Corynebacterium sp.]
MSNKLVISSDAPIELVLPLLRNDERLQSEIVKYDLASADDVAYWLRTKGGQAITLDYGPKADVDEMETFIAIDWDEESLQAYIVQLLRELPYECRRYDEFDEEITFRPDGALPPARWIAT